MDHKDLENIIKQKKYGFLRENINLKNKILFITVGGSYAYGTNIETSDLDLRGCAVNSESDLLGLTNFEQFVDSQTDTTIYAFNKLIRLLINCNPNCIELLGNQFPEKYIYNNSGKDLIENRKLFLSQRAIYSFGGYAHQQFERLKKGLPQNYSDQLQKNENIKQSYAYSFSSINEKYSSFGNGDVSVSLNKNNDLGKDEDFFVDINLTHYPLKSCKNILNDLDKIVNNYNDFNHRNHKKDLNHLAKHSMHLIRLYLMCIDILEKEDIITYRNEEHDLLMDIRNQKYFTSDGALHSAFWDILKKYQDELAYAQKNTNLPKEPDFKSINDFVMETNFNFLFKRGN